MVEALAVGTLGSTTEQLGASTLFGPACLPLRRDALPSIAKFGTNGVATRRPPPCLSRAGSEDTWSVQTVPVLDRGSYGASIPGR